MKQKLTTLLFGLLLAVGWTSSAFAQSATYKAADMTDWTYQWGNASGETQTSHYVVAKTENGKTVYKAEEVHDPYQIYGLLKNVYMDKRFPGPFYSAYSPGGTNRQDPVYYGGITGGWNIPEGNPSAVGNITIAFDNGNFSFRSIQVKSGNTVLTEWSYSTNGTSLPNNNWSRSKTFSNESSTSSCYMAQGGTITINSSLLQGATNVTVVINGRHDPGYNAYVAVSVNGSTGTASSQIFTKEDHSEWATHTWTVSGKGDVNFYKPIVNGVDNEGYTAIMVALYNDTTKIHPENLDYYDGSWEFSDSTSLINYIRDNIDFVKVLTDGLRIGSGLDVGTVFNCDGIYNKFFILGKGQARKKADQLNTFINNHTWPAVCGEEGPFKQMFEEFSPTTGAQGSDITNFYSKMMEGATYNVVHDCASVIQNKHQFSMSGKKGEEYKALSGLNFFIPDYRLLWWSTTANGYTVDGRDMVPYIATNTSTGEHTGTQFYSSTDNVYHFAAWYAQYNQQHAPKMGIYKITLAADAEMIAESDTTHAANNHNYTVTLTWVSSLNEMSGHDVPQTYTVYYYDDNGELQWVPATALTNGQTGETTITYSVPQKPHSYTIDYIVMGQPNSNDHPSFIAWSNVDGVVIPGWDDFLALTLDHHESDYQAADRANWYRNFLLVENDMSKGLTYSKINDGMTTFNLYRWDNKDASEKKIAVLTFDNPTATQVHYKVAYSDNQTAITLNPQNILEPTGNTNKYKRATMQIPDEGYVRVKGNGDLVIQPNGYAVNFKSITVKNGNNTVASWTSSQNSLPSSWYLSPGSMWVKHTTTEGGTYYYLEGGGYIAIPNILNNSSYTDLSVVIDAFGDGSSISKITVNDHPKKIDNDANSINNPYTWGSDLLVNRGTRANTTYEKVTSTDQLVDGKKYIFVYENGANSYAMGNLKSDGDASAVSVTINDNAVTVGDDVVPFTLGTSISSYYRTYAFPNGDLLALNRSTNPYSFTTGGSYTTWRINGGSTGYYTYNAEYQYYIKYSDSYGFYLSSQSSSSGRAFFYVEKETTPEPPTPTEDGLLRLGHLHIVDQFKETVKDDNTHPDTYTYILRYQPTEGDAKESGEVDVDIQKTEVKANGNYTVAEIDADTIAGLTMDIISADVTMDLTKVNPEILDYQMQGKANAEPLVGKDYLTKLQMQTSGKYKEMLHYFDNGDENPAFGNEYDATIHHYYDMDSVYTGTYTGNNYFCYAPSVSTWGIDRRYYETDGMDNTYGGPLWKTGVGDVDFQKAMAQKQMKQVTIDGQQQWVPNPSTSWTEGDVEGAQAYTLYFLSTQAQGYLPKTTVSNIAYEPYMFRVFVESASGKLRKYKPVMYTNTETGAQTQIGLKDGGPITGKYCVGSYDINSGTWSWDSVATVIQFNKDINSTAPTAGVEGSGWSGNMMFGATPDISDLMIYVRFYYMTPGWNTRAGDGPDRPGNGAERGGQGGSDTGIIEIFGVGNGEVVSTTYYNAQGIQSDKPFDGLNIVVTRYSNGTTSTTKVIR